MLRKLPRLRTTFPALILVAIIALTMGLTVTNAASPNPTTGWTVQKVANAAAVGDTPNTTGKIPSFNSGLVAPPPCSNTALLIPIYEQAGATYDIPWQVLAGINQVETNFGCNLSTSSAGAIGWMQFEPGTWERYGVDATGDGVAEPNNAVDAIFSAARYLGASGGATNLYNAIFSYNHAGWYVAEVLSDAQNFETMATPDLAMSVAVEKRLSQLHQRIGVATSAASTAQTQISAMNTRLHSFRHNYNASSAKLSSAREHLATLEADSQGLVKQYVGVAYYSDVGTLNTEGNSQDMLSYIANTQTPQQAVLTYTTAQVLLNSRKDLLQRIQNEATSTRVERNTIAQQADTRLLLVLQQQQDIAAKKQFITDTRVAEAVLNKTYQTTLQSQQLAITSNLASLNATNWVNPGGDSVGGTGTIPVPTTVPASVQSVIAGANAIANTPYVYGGGHASFQSSSYDCSGSVSYALAAGGMLSSPETSGELENWGAAGPGKWITVYASAGHVYMYVNIGTEKAPVWAMFNTVGRSSNHSSRWQMSSANNGGFVARHWPGL